MTSTPSDSALPVLISNSRDPSPTSLIASMAFMIRFRITCCSWTLSPKMRGSPSDNCIFTETPCSDIAAWVSLDNLHDCFVDSKFFLLHRRFLGEIVNSAHNIGGPLAVADDTVDRLPGLFHIWRLTVEPAYSVFSIRKQGARGWLTSWAIEAVSSPIVVTRFACASSASARFRSVKSRAKATPWR